MIDCVVFDIDGTLANADHRLHHIRDGKKDWAAFFDGMLKDPVNHPIRRLLWMVQGSEDGKVILCSGRPEEYREVTEAWLEENQVGYDRLYMRPSGDRRDDDIVKKELLDQMRADGYEPWLAIDDRNRVIQMWKENGIMVLAVNGGGDF